MYLKFIVDEASMPDAIAERRRGIGMSQEDLEDRVNLTTGHAGKIENGGKPWAKRILRMTPTLAWVLEALGLELVVMDRDTARKLAGLVAERRERTHVDKATRVAHPTGQRMIVRAWRRP